MVFNDSALQHETFAEKYALFAVRLGTRWTPLFCLALALVSWFALSARPALSPRGFSTWACAGLALLYWERLAFRRLLARRDAELRQMSADKRTA